MKCRKGYEIEPLKSAAGWYMGTTDKGFPNCRISQGYAPTYEESLKLPLDRQCSNENVFCHGGHGCVG